MFYSTDEQSLGDGQTAAQFLEFVTLLTQLAGQSTVRGELIDKLMPF